MLSRHGLYETLRRQGVQFHSAEEVIGARKATAAEAGLLQAPRGSTVLTMTRVAIDPAGRAIEYGVHAYLAERYSFRVALGPMTRADPARGRRTRESNHPNPVTTTRRDGR